MGLTLAVVMVAQSCARDGHHSFIAEYVEPSRHDLRDLEAKVKSDRLLEKMADSFDEYLNLPEPVRISFAQCGVANAFYGQADHRITLCYELLVDLAQRFSTDAKARELLGGAVTFVSLHELGHAVIHVLDLPVLGREEDAADELAALIAIEGPHGAPVILGAVTWLASNARSGSPVSLPEMADGHALVEQRAFNMLCYAYGSDPSANQNLVTVGLLTAERAAKCPDEFAQIKKSWYNLLGAHLKKPFNSPEQETSVGGTINAPRVPPVGPRAGPGNGGGSGGGPLPGGAGGASAPTCPVQPEPNYTDDARQAHIQGTVVLDTIIQEDGTIVVNKVERSLGYGLDDEAKKVLKKWKCNPGKVNGQPVDVQLQIVINFHLY